MIVSGHGPDATSVLTMGLQTMSLIGVVGTLSLALSGSAPGG
jgi:hypothetical protein